MLRKYGRDPQLWLTETAGLMGFNPGMIQRLLADGLVKPLEEAFVRRGRTIFGKQTIVQLLLVRSLIESAMPRDEIKEFMDWLWEGRAVLWTYPRAPTEYKLIWSDTDELRRFSRWYDLKFDPLPPLDKLNSWDVEMEGYPKLPTTEEEWPEYWAGVKQILAIDQYKMGEVAVNMVLFPARLAYSDARYAQYVRKWCQRVLGAVAIDESIIRTQEETQTLRFIDLARFKAKASEMILRHADEFERQDKD